MAYPEEVLTALAQKIFDELGPTRQIDLYTKGCPDLSMEEAYRVQFMLAKMRREAGHHQIGMKIGLSNPAIQQQFGVNEPVFGHMFDIMGLDDNAIDTDKYITPIIEPEITFLLKKDLKGPGVTRADVLAATEGVFASIELPNKRYPDQTVSAQDMLVVDTMAQGLVLGNTLYDPRNLDLRSQGVILEINGNVLATGAGAAVLDHPANSLAWLANRLVDFGSFLKAGAIVPAGSFTAAAFPKKGDRVKVTFTQLGSVEAYFV
jgi:2-keto-4-pentenoate hydratase